MAMAAILVMWPGPFEQTSVPLSHGGIIWNLTLIGQAVSEENMFIEDYLHYTLTSEPSVQVS